MLAYHSEWKPSASARCACSTIFSGVEPPPVSPIRMLNDCLAPRVSCGQAQWGMATARRTGTETSKTRATLLDVTERLMRNEGYAAVSSRRVASEAGVTGALVHYYFPTLDDLFLAVFRRGAERNLERHARALESPRPLRAL